MLDSFEETLLSALQTIFDQFGWLGVFGLMIFENATGITSSEIILGFAGWMLIERHGFSPSFIPLAGLYAGLGSIIGASVPYWIARLGGRPLVEWFAKFFRIHLEYIEKIEQRNHQDTSFARFHSRISDHHGLSRVSLPRIPAAFRLEAPK